MYFVLETQVNDGVGAMLPAITKNTLNEAESEYHRILQYAAISDVDVHGAIILGEDCFPVMYKAYTHIDNEVEDE